jgi:chromosome segregation ATPase
MPKKHIADHFAEWMKRIEEVLEHKMHKTDGEDLEERLSDLESNHEDLDSRHEELSEKVEDLEGEQADADSRIDDLESEVR